MKPDAIVLIVAGVIVLVFDNVLQWVVGVTLILLGILSLTGHKK